jgi:hypothetical protein
MTTPAAIRAEVCTQLGVAESVLDETGPDRSAATDLARAVALKLITDETDLSVREASLAMGFRSAESGKALLARLAAGDYEAEPALPSKFAGSTAAVLSATLNALEPS